jgi:hypothetical protein
VKTHSTTTRYESFPGPGNVGNITLSGVFQEVCKGSVGSALVERDDIGLPVGPKRKAIARLYRSVRKTHPGREFSSSPSFIPAWIAT